MKDQGWRLLGAAVQLVAGPTVSDFRDTGIAGNLLKAAAPGAGAPEDGLNQLMTLQADHGASASTLAVRTAISTGAGLHPSILAGLATFGGDRYGGAMEAVVRLLESISDPDHSTARTRCDAFIDELRRTAPS